MTIKKAVVKALFVESMQALRIKVKLLSAWSSMYQHETREKVKKVALTDDIKQNLDNLRRNDINFDDIGSDIYLPWS